MDMIELSSGSVDPWARQRQQEGVFLYLSSTGLKVGVGDDWHFFFDNGTL